MLSVFNRKGARLGKADLHIHSTYSDGAETPAHILAHAEHVTDLDVIAIADHDCIYGSLLARDLAAQRSSRVQVITGAEISTHDGHLLALNIERLIAAGLSMAETIQAVHEQGGIAVVAHPMSWWCPSASRRVLDALLTDPRSTPDGLEVINSSFAGLASNVLVRTLNRAHFRRAETGGSDAHTLSAIGSSYTRFPGHNATDLLFALRECCTSAEGGFWPLRSFLQYGMLAVRLRLA